CLFFFFFIIMCVYSMIADHYYDKWKPLVPNPWYPIPDPNVVPVTPSSPVFPYIFLVVPSKEEIEEFSNILKKDKKYDEEHNQKDCEAENKKKKILKLAKQLGIEESLKFLKDELKNDEE